MRFWNKKTAKFPFNNRGEVDPTPDPVSEPLKQDTDFPGIPGETDFPGIKGEKPKYSMENPPKSKDEWQKLAQEDSKTWIDLTQARMDQMVRESREWKEKYNQVDVQRRNLEAELQTRKPIELPVEQGFDPEKPFSPNNLPASQEQWDQLWIENPNLAADLRQIKNEQTRINQERQVREQTEFSTEQKKHRAVLQERHPDMYVSETNPDGTLRVDGNGKPLLRIDPNTGEPIPNLDSEKGKLWVEIFNEDPHGFMSSKRGPRLLMLELERRLRETAEKNISAQGSDQTTQPDQRGTLPGGVTPPISVNVKFDSEEEKYHAQRGVERGTWKSLEDYCRHRDTKDPGMIDENRVPNFG